MNTNSKKCEHVPSVIQDELKEWDRRLSNINSCTHVKFFLAVFS